MSMARAVEQAVNELSPVCLRLGAFSAIVDGMNQCGSPCSAGKKRGVGRIHLNHRIQDATSMGAVLWRTMPAVARE